MELRTALDGPLVLRAGDTLTHSLLVTDLGEEAVDVRTNGRLTAEVLDGDGGRTVTPDLEFTVTA